ncbi:hypothetical protein EBX31_00355 [bacterium]|nr:hypothetical protein [bacterium]
MVGAAIWERLRRVLGAAQHVLLAGAAGCGKSCALRLLLGTTVSLWFRCSADPSLRDGRERIKAVARRRGDGPTWIVLEHADLLQSDAQAFLRRVIETSNGSTRFVLEVRDLAAVAEPLLSRTVLFNVPGLLDYEVRGEVMRRVPELGLAEADRIATQARGNVRWAVLQALGGGDSLVAATVPPVASVDGWAALLAAMEEISRTGTSQREWVGDSRSSDSRSVGGDWDRPGGACPWALTANAVCARF